MKIQGPLVVDVSLWNDHLNIQELIDGGVVSVIIGLYKQVDGKTLNVNCKRMADQVAASPLIMQTYCYYYPERDPVAEADWFTGVMSGYPVKYAWADCEAYKVVMTPLLRSEQNRRFAEELHKIFPPSGVYTAKWYTDGYCTTTLPNGTTVNEMDRWLPKYLAWVAQYGHEPLSIPMTWAVFKAFWLPNYDIILSAGQLPSQVVGHQFTDKPILPGAYNTNNVRMTLDVSVFTPAFIQSLGTIVAPPVPLTLEQRVANIEKNELAHGWTI
jgi:GH25 family lysozyme M1 (1,4-beta-N-acetylmuramidase)